MSDSPSGDTFVGQGPRPYDEQADLEGVPAFMNYGTRENRQSWRSLDHLHLLRNISPEQRSWNDASTEAMQNWRNFDWWFPPRAET